MFWFDLLSGVASILGLCLSIWILVLAKGTERMISTGLSLQDLPPLVEEASNAMGEIVEGRDVAATDIELVIRVSEAVGVAETTLGKDLSASCKIVVRNADRWQARRDFDSSRALWESLVRLEQRLKNEGKRRLWKS